MAALEKVVDDTVAAVVTEPIQGENGVIEPPDDFLPAVRRITAEHGALMWIDEVQTGMGRCGEWFAHQRLDVVPDLISVAKGLGNGFPMGHASPSAPRPICSAPVNTARRSVATRWRARPALP